MEGYATPADGPETQVFRAVFDNRFLEASSR
jgi:hypothetical protein